MAIDLRSRLTSSLLWLLPATILCEYLSRWIEKPLIVRVLFCGLFLSAFWIVKLPQELVVAQATPTQPSPSRGRRALGMTCLLIGALVLGLTVWKVWGTAVGLPLLALPEWFDRDGVRLSLPILCAWPLALGAAWAPGRSVGARSYEQLGLWIAFALLVQLASGEHVQDLQLLPDAHITRWVLLFSLFVLVALLSTERGPFAARLALLVLAGAALQLVGIETWEIEPDDRDMLALIESAHARFFAQLKHPYAVYAMQQDSEVPLTYLPGLWLVYAIPRAFDLDIRVISVVLQVAFAAALLAVTRRVPLVQRSWAQALVAVFCACWFFSPSVLWNVIYAEPAVWWGVLGLLLCAFMTERHALAAVLLGVAIGTRHFAIVLVPFAILHFVRALGMRRALPYIALAGVVASALIAPFALSNPELFWFGTFRWLREYGPANIESFHDRFSFMDWFAETNTMGLMPFVQVAVVLGLVACAIWVVRARERHMQSFAFASTAYLLCLMLNTLFWNSFLLDGAVLAVCGVLFRHVHAQPQGPTAVPATERSPSKPALALAGAGLLISAACAAALVSSLVHAERRKPPTAIRALLLRSLGENDALIDRSDRRLAFVEGTWLLNRAEVKAPIGEELYSRAWDGRPAFEKRPSLWLVTEADRDYAMRAMFERLGLGATLKAFDHLRVQSVRAYQARAIVQDKRLIYEVSGKRVDGVMKRKVCVVGSARGRMLSLPAPVAGPRGRSTATLRWPEVKLGQTLLLAGGSPDPQITWPRSDVRVDLFVNGRLHAPSDGQLPNLRGMHWNAWDTSALAARKASVAFRLGSEPGPRATQTLPHARELCLEVFVLE